MHLTMTQMWDVIDDLAEATKRRPMLQADGRAQMVEANLERSGEDIAEAMMVESDTESTGSNEEEPTWEITPEPDWNIHTH